MHNLLDGKTVLITGGTGSFGKNFVKHLLNNSQAKKIIIFSRDELKQSQMKSALKNNIRLRFFLGDVRDLSRLQRAFSKVDIVVHAAALKQVPTLEYNPFEAIKTNILGSQNVIEAAIDQQVEKVVLISTDKASQPINLYGSTKLCAEKLFISGNSYASRKTKFSCVRYGNVIASRGSVIEKLLRNQPVAITDPAMTRFWLTLEQSFQLVLFALKNMEGGEIFIPKVPSMKIVDIFAAIAPGIKREVVGILPGEKVHEMLLSNEEAKHSVSVDKYFIILPEFEDIYNMDIYKKFFQYGSKLPPNFSYMSHTNDQWLTKEELLNILRRLKTRH